VSALSPAEAALVARPQQAALLDQVLAWSAINSGTGNLDGLGELGAAIASLAAQLPGEVAWHDPAPTESVRGDGRTAAIAHGRHLVLSVRPKADRRVLLTGHMDTVFAPVDPFQTCRWLDSETLNGPGTADMKGGIAVLLAGLAAFESTGPQLGYDVLLNSDEETGSLSSAPLIRELAAGKLAALTYEPALPGGVMAGARPGSGNWSAVVCGRAAHAGRNPEEGRNALLAASDLALRLAALRRPGLSVNPAKIDGGGPNNVVPDMAVLRFNMRPATPELAALAEAEIARVVAEVGAGHEVSIHLHGGMSRPPKPLDPAAEALFGLVGRAAADLGQSFSRKDTGGVCDGNNIAACGVPVIDTMGVLGGAIHSPDEFLLVNSLAERARLTALTLHRLELEGLHP
jgi:glutamate carboxypeptidase